MKKLSDLVPAKATPDEQMRELNQAVRNDRVFSEADTCADCQALRAAKGDKEALCERHFAASLGF